MRYQATGFIPVNEPPATRRILCAATIDIVKGDALHDDGNGYATNATTAFDSATFLGFAAEDVDNTPAVAGKTVAYHPINAATQYRVPVEENAAITQTAIGTNVDMEDVNNIDISDASTEGLAFRIDAIDISADAIAANTYGYAIGRPFIIVTEA